MDRVSVSRCSLLDRPGRNHEGPPRSLLRLLQKGKTFWIHTVKLYVQLVLWSITFLAFVVKDRPSDLTTINVAIERYWYFAINGYNRQNVHLCFSTAYLDLRRHVDFMICILKP